MYIRVPRKQRPIKPIGFVILTIGVVVAVLCSSDFVAHQEHGQTEGKHCDSEEILYLTVSESLHGRIIGRALKTAIPASIVVCAVAIIFAIGFVMLSVVRNEIVESESVVTCYEVYALFRLAFLVTIDFVAAKHSVSEARQRAVFATEKTSHVVAKLPIPLFPTVPNEAPHLIQSSRVPCFCNHLGPGQSWFRLDVPKHGGIRHYVA